MKKTVLVAEDQIVNRKILKQILQEQYNIIECVNGEEALDVIKNKSQQISAILLDLNMPVMNGFEFLETVKGKNELFEIPIIVTTQSENRDDERKALLLGANDYVIKPYEPVILKKRLDNLIKFYETDKNLLQMETDTLTGLYNQEAIYRKIETSLEQKNISHSLISITIEQTKLIIERYGIASFNDFIISVANFMKEAMKQFNAVAARYDTERFVIYAPTKVDQAMADSIVNMTKKFCKDYPLPIKIVFHFGIYMIDNVKLNGKIICDRAFLASETLKSDYRTSYAFYNDTVIQKINREQLILDSLQNALLNHQFKVFLQPKYSLKDNAITGAEALTRWTHPTLGALSPSEFIPLFEKNGFITELGLYVMEETCKIVKSFYNEFLEFVPISVNVSRRDIYQPNLIQSYIDILNKYDIEPKQIHLEITESAYTDDPSELIKIVSQLQKKGFVIEMDDFGKGYSSLTMLSKLPIDILKLDMDFIEKNSESDKWKSILSFVMKLSELLKMPVVAEGVETKDQVSILKEMGCAYVQGYYFGEPMDVEHFKRIWQKK